MKEKLIKEVIRDKDGNPIAIDYTDGSRDNVIMPFLTSTPNPDTQTNKATPNNPEEN